MTRRGSRNGSGGDGAGYRSVLVAFDDQVPFSEEAVATAKKLAAGRRHGIHVISLLTVPNDLSLDAPLDDAEQEAQSRIERAKLICGTQVTGRVRRVRPNQGGRAIADEARSTDASAIVVRLPYRNGTPVYGSTIRTLLAERPSRVIVVGGRGAGR